MKNESHKWHCGLCFPPCPSVPPPSLLLLRLEALFPALKEEEDPNRLDEETGEGETRIMTLPPPTYGMCELLVAECARVCSLAAVIFGFTASVTVRLPGLFCLTLSVEEEDLTGSLPVPSSLRGGGLVLPGVFAAFVRPDCQSG